MITAWLKYRLALAILAVIGIWLSAFIQGGGHSDCIPIYEPKPHTRIDHMTVDEIADLKARRGYFTNQYGDPRGH